MGILSLPTGVIGGSSQEGKVDTVADRNLVVTVELLGIICAVTISIRFEGYELV